MSKHSNKAPEIMPGADPETDCLGPEETAFPATDAQLGGVRHGEQARAAEHDVNWGDLEVESEERASPFHSWAPARARWLRFLEKIALLVERPANRLIGTAQLNPFYHTGTIAVLLMIIVALTGFYLFVFFKYGFDASYNDVLTRLEEPFIARTIRAVHRYASGALVITTLLHAYRTLFMERFRGPRWLAWVTGIMMTILLWFGGVTGYWLIWDQRAQLINDSFVNFLQAVTPFAASYVVMLTEADISGVSWPLFLTVFGIHLLMFIIPAFFFWLHIKRLSRPKWLPPPYWVIGVGLVVLLVGLLFPAGMLPQADLQQIPGPVTIDPLFLFFLPVSGNPILSWALWGGLLLLTAVFVFLPWLRLRRASAPVSGVAGNAALPKVTIIKDRCNGCTVCALDCPYGAIQMVERSDGKLHKYVAVEDPSLCVSCGICVGSCDVVAVTMGDAPPVMLWEDISTHLTLAKKRNPTSLLKVIFTCERHAAHGARPYLDHSASLPEGIAVEVITLSCVGTIPPDLLSRTLDQGVSEVQVVGCPPDDCTNREGNLWTEQRLVRERVPRLKRPYANAPITAYWLPPDDFYLAFEATPTLPVTSNGDDSQVDFLEQRRINKDLNWRNYIVAFILLAAVMVLQVLLTDLPLTRVPDPPAMTQVIVADLARPIGRSSYISTILGTELLLSLEVDGQPVYHEIVNTAELLAVNSTPFYLEHEMTPGDHQLRLILVDNVSDVTFVLFDEKVPLQAGQIFRYGH